MNQIVLNQENLAKLESFIQEMPVKYGLPLIQFLNELAKEQGSDAEAVEE
jgi:hypothetical protein